MNLIFKKENLLLFFFIIYICFGFYSSLNTGISHDEYHEEIYWNFNKELVINFFSNNSNEEFLSFRDKYYGIGFQLISQPIQYFLKHYISIFYYVDEYGSKLISKHFVIFLFFFISGIYLRKILFLLTENKNFSTLGSLFYLLYPYLFGHSLMNPKDIPFLSIWLILTYYNFSIILNFFQNKKLLLKDLLALSILTAFLISIRISGLLILIQFFISFILTFNIMKLGFEYFFKNLFSKAIFFLVSALFFIILLYPIFWTNPFLLIDAIKFMGNFPQDICTQTFGKCLRAQNLDPLYIPSWLLVKLPILIIIGIILIPLSEKKIFASKKNQIIFGSILITSIFIPFILIFLKTPLYDELRQILFLIPLYIIIGLVSFYFLIKNLINKILFVFIVIFIFENFYTYPYQYTWFNFPSRLIQLEKKFELDYWGISGKKIAEKINSNNIEKKCLVVSPQYLIKPYINEKKIDCYYNWQSIEQSIPRPFYAIQLVRNLKSSIPYKCEIIHSEFIDLSFYKKNTLNSANLIECK